MPKRKNKEKWPVVAFGDVVKRVQDKISPADSGLDRYIAGEHMDTDDLKIRRWGLIGSDYLGPAFHMRFKPGQVLYGSRRTYLRKVAVADFEGITSNTTFVIESRDPAILLPQLLPFIMQTESFHAYSIGQSKGSVNPYINFSDLLEYEFTLPPLTEQQRIAEVLQAVEVLRESLTDNIENSERLRTSLCIDLQRKNHSTLELAINSLLLFSKSGLWGKEEGKDETGIIVLRSTDLDGHGILNMAGGANRSIPTNKLASLQLQANDILLEKSGGGPDQPVGRVGFVEAISDRDFPFICGNFIQLLRPNTSKVNPDWLFWMMHGLHSSKWTLRHQTQTTGIRNLQINDYLSDCIPVPSLDVQKQQAYEIRSVEEARRDFLIRIGEVNQLKYAILNSHLHGNKAQ